MTKLGWLPAWKVQIDGDLVVIVDVYDRKPGYVFIQRWNGESLAVTLERLLYGRTEIILLLNT